MTHTEKGALGLCKPDMVNFNVHFASLSSCLAFPVKQDLPFDTYNLKVDINALRCPFCSAYFCSPAELKRHRRAMHKGMRASGVEDFKLEEMEDLPSVNEIIDERNGEYLCKLDDDDDMENKYRKFSQRKSLFF